jgi:TIR domain
LPPKLFISYSRAQTPFVDRLADQLEDTGYSLWLDYQRLVPARPWFEQIEAGIDAADVVLLIVSKESLASKNVEPEWKRAVDRGKRILLVIFQAVPLPPELQGCEWEDFRTDYRHAYRELIQRIEGPGPAQDSAPQSGFKAPPVVWLSLVLSVIVLMGSIPAWWTLVLPVVLAPLPRQIYQRNYIFHRVVPTLLVLPLVYWLSWWMMFSTPTSIFWGVRGFALTWFPLSLVAGWLLAGLLLTPDMQRRGLPEAARLRFANPLMVNRQTLRPILFAIDHASEDLRYADRLKRALEENGHRMVGGDETAEATFVLMSAYKKQTAYDTDHQAVYPILLQSVREVSLDLQRIQWIDFRSGLQQVDKLARLLPEPEGLLKGLAVPPTGSQEIFPFTVSSLMYFTLITGLLQGGGLLLSLLGLLVWALRGNSVRGAEAQILGVMLSGFLLLGTMNLAVRALRSRVDGASALYPLFILNVFQVAISLSSMMVIAVYRQGANLEAEVRLLNMAGRASAVNWIVLPLAVLVITVILLVRWQELYRWLPRRRGDTASALQSWLLLYTPPRRAALILHFVFHGLFLLLYVMLNLWSIFAGWWFVPYLVICCFVILGLMLGIRYWARRVSG